MILFIILFILNIPSSNIQKDGPFGFFSWDPYSCSILDTSMCTLLSVIYSLILLLNIIYYLPLPISPFTSLRHTLLATLPTSFLPYNHTISALHSPTSKLILSLPQVSFHHANSSLSIF